MDLVVGGKVTSSTLTDVLYVPKIASNLISVSNLTAKGMRVTFKKCHIVKKDGALVAEATRINRMYHLRSKACEALFAASAKEETSVQLWHERLAHLGVSGMKLLQAKDMVRGLPCFKGVELPVCEGCVKGKCSRLPFPKNERKRASKPLELVH